MTLLMCPHMVNERAFSGVSFIKAQIPFMMVPPLPKPLPPNAITLGVRVSIHECWGTQTFNSEELVNV